MLYLPQADEDKILEKIDSLFDSKVGKPYDDETLEKLYKEGETRFNKLIPPGFEDKKKEGNKKYGDFILWKQILDFAKENSLPIIFIIREKKPDWWNKKNGEIISPRIELRREFQENVKQQFWMYTPENFLKCAKEKFQLDINPRSIEETNQIADAESTDKVNMPDTTILSKVIEQQSQLSKNFAETMENINFNKVIEQQNQLSKNFAKTMQNINFDQVIEQQNQLSKNISDTIQNVNFDQVIEQQNQLSKNISDNTEY
ncbi:MAG: hypothetical protein F6K40_06720 [Okeania sp. SIO3I5]|uniref:PIN-like domain-containing protein n=1 Tax=Okeania sp. SIO3I5 TaxID=2607805 RepID=UPI0013BB1035|nr:PIN-like domain-containing protein [Okeania sp. SIO3I5]NEQ35994.1 hypothetical protein [Okeania sp. SIO3I5]